METLEILKDTLHDLVNEVQLALVYKNNGDAQTHNEKIEFVQKRLNTVKRTLDRLESA